MNLSRQVQEVLNYIAKIEVPTHLSPQETGRLFYEKFIPLAGEKEEVFQVENRTILEGEHPIPIRIYRPNDQTDLPVIIYMHGGWFNAGSLETHDTPLRQLANLAQATIISIDYRLAPELPFPAGLNDCEFAVQWVIDNATLLNINPNKIIIAGDSAGGALAATISRKFRTDILAQVLIYPVTDNSLSTPSWIEFQNGPLLDVKGGIQAWDWYLSKTEDKENANAIPLLANDIKGLPPTFIAIAAYDPLKDEAIQYAEKLQDFEVKTELKRYKGMTHGFFQMGGYLEETKMLMNDIVEFIKTIIEE